MRYASLIAAAAFVASATFADAQEVPPGAFLRIDSGVHSGVVRHIALSADEQTMVTASFDKTIRVWNLPGGTLRKTFRVPIGDGFEGSAYAVALSPDGRTIAVGGWMKQQYVYLLDSGTGAVLRALGPNPDIVNHLSFSPDGRKLAAVLGTRNGMRLWNAATGTLVAEDQAYGRDTYALDFDRAGNFITGSYDGLVRLYDPEGRRITSVPGRSGLQIDDADFTPDGRSLAVSYAEKTAVDILDVGTRSWQAGPDLAGIGNGGVASVAWSRDGASLFIGSQTKDKDGYFQTLRVNLAQSPAPVVVLRTIDTASDLEPYAERDFAFSTSSPQLGIVRDSAFALNIETNIAAMGTVGVNGIRASADGHKVLFATDYGGKDRYVFDAGQMTLSKALDQEPSLAEPDTGGLEVNQLVNTFEPRLNGQKLSFDSGEWAMTAASFADRQRFVLGSGWYIRAFDTTGAMQWRTAVTGWAWGVTTTRDGSMVVGAFGDGTVRWFRASDGQLLLTLFVVKDASRWIAWTPSGYYASSPGGETLAGWHVNRADTETPDYLPVGTFRATYYRPEVLRNILTTLDEGKALAR